MRQEYTKTVPQLAIYDPLIESVVYQVISSISRLILATMNSMLVLIAVEICHWMSRGTTRARGEMK